MLMRGSGGIQLFKRRSVTCLGETKRVDDGMSHAIAVYFIVGMFCRKGRKVKGPRVGLSNVKACNKAT